MSDHLNPFNRESEELATYQRHVYDDTGVLRNLAGIRDQTELDMFERRATSRRSELPLPDEARQFSFDGFKAIHRHIFQDVYEWAGEVRTYTTGRNEAPFARPEHIEREARKLFEKLNGEHNFAGYSKPKFAEKSAELICEINAIHPFVDGNGRTMRRFLRHLAKENGYQFELASTDKDQWNEASRVGFLAFDHEPMRALIQARLIERERAHEFTGLWAERDQDLER